jgi:hypothetical protein
MRIRPVRSCGCGTARLKNISPGYKRQGCVSRR